MAALWLALHLPLLPLEAHPGLPSPSAVAAGGRVLACDTVAEANGVAAGMGLTAARALAPTLNVVARDMAREAAALAALACWAGGFTPSVYLLPPRQDRAASALLLEIGACLRLFGGVERIAAAVSAGVTAQGYSLRYAVAPSAQGALWLAQTMEATVCIDGVALAARLAALPVAALDLPPMAVARLTQFGVRTLGEARRLPSAALARRIGQDALVLMVLMARAFGELPDPRPPFVFPAQFGVELELPAPVDNAAALLFAARRLTASLAGWLAARHSGVLECVLHLRRERQPATLLPLRFVSATRDPARFERVLRERLERLVLTAPVAALRLEATGVEPLLGHSGGLFEASHGSEDMAALLERLRARLGETNVHGLACRAEHRPECATAAVPQDGGETSAATPRPLWLLARPQALRERGGRLYPPRCKEPLQLLAGPERIESGWWEEGELRGKLSGEMGGAGLGDVRRDYFVALAADGRWLWIYRDNRLPGGWFLHGLFA